MDPAQTVAAAAGLQPGDLKPKTPAATEQLRSDLQAIGVTGSVEICRRRCWWSTPPSIPVVLPGWIEQAVRTACARGDPIEVKKIGDISVLNDIVLYDSVAWIQGRFGGQHPTNVCVGV